MNYFKVIDTAIRRAYVDQREYKKQLKANADQSVRLFNWWGDVHGLWLRDFVLKRDMLPKDRWVNFCGVGGYRGVISHIEGPKIFFPLENLHDDRMNYADHLMYGKAVDLALGYDYFIEPNYMRFPLWPLYMFAPDATDEQIIKRCTELCYPDVSSKTKFGSLVARYDWHGTRSQIYNAISHIDKIYCPSSVCHNDDELKTKFADDKEEYLRQFYFNICPENSDSYGYVTEKIFEAISAGCIPIYWGSYNNPEPGILNKDAIIFWNMDGDNSAAVKEIEELYANPKLLDEFIHQPRLLPNAEEYILDMLHELETKLRKVVKVYYK